jgi:hypothetical protein
MTDQDQTFILEILKRIQADVADIKRGQWTLTERVSSVEVRLYLREEAP